MAIGKRKRTRQPTMWVATTDLPTAVSHPFYMRLNQLLREHRFDGFAERTFAWLNQFRCLRVRYDKRGDIHQAFLSLGCALICWRSLRTT